jgi:hypothetical protein
VFIKTTCEATNLRLEEDKVEIECGGELTVVVSIEPGKTAGKFSCTALGKVIPPPEYAGHLSGDTTQANPKFDQYLRDIEVRLFYGYLGRAIRLLMWRRGINAEYTIPLHREAFWSIDGEHWQQFNLFSIKIVFGMPSKRGQVPAEVLTDVGKLVESGQDEPLAHGLLRDAWSRRSESHRISLMLAISAAEVGIKDFVSKLVPDASWIVTSIQTPPLRRMLTEYLPLLPVKARLEGKTLVPPDELLHEIGTGNDLRNKAIHQGRIDIAADKLERVLRAVNDLLWILDVYQGHVWAIRSVRPEILTAWKQDSGKKG